MGNYDRFYGLAVFVLTCLLVKSHAEDGGGQRRGGHVYQALRRPLSAALASGDDDDTQTPAVMWGSLLLTVVITTVLVLVLALCTCGKKSNNKSSAQESEISPDENPEVTQQPVGNGPSSPVVVTGDTPQQPPKTPSPEIAARGASFSPGSPNGGAMLTSPPSPNFCDMSDILYADASPTASPSHAPTRGATINRQLPQLPPVVIDGDEKDQDYDGTYDVIPEKRKDTPTDDYDRAGGYERLRDTKAKGPLMPPDPKEGPYAKVNESRKRTISLEELTDPNYNSIEETRGAVAGSPPKAGIEVDSDLETDGHYASVEGRKKDAPYARVKDRDEIDRSNGYCRVREVQTSPAAERSAVAITTRVSPIANRRMAQDEDELPPAVPEKLPDLENGIDSCMSPGSQSHQRLPSIGSMGSGGSGISIGYVERTSPVPPASPQLSNNQASLAASIAAGTAAAAAGDFADQATNATQPTNVPVREKPYTQVSARESLEFVRARQQAEHTALTAHYELVNENENDYDGIYETVNEGQMSPQPEPPPLPHNRQPQGPVARLAVYEEINDNDRHQTAPAAVVVEVDDDEMQPYASTHNPTAAARQPYSSSQSPSQNRQPYASSQNSSPANRQYASTQDPQPYGSTQNPSPGMHRHASLPARSSTNMSPEAVYAQVDKDRGGSVKNSDLYTQVKRSPGTSVRVVTNHDTRPKVNGAHSPPEPPAMPSNQQGDNFEDLYSKVQKQPSLDGMGRMNGPQRQNGIDMIVHSSPEGAAPDSSYQSIDECLNDDDVGNRARAAGLVHTSQIKPSVSNKQRKPKEHTYQAVDDNKNAKKIKKEKKEKKNKKDQAINRTPSPQPNNNPPVWQRREIAPHSGYEDVNVNNAPMLHTSVNDNANRSRSRTNSKEHGKMNGYSNQDVRIRANSREQIGVNGIAPPAYTKGNRSRTNSHEYSGMNGGLPQNTKRFSGPIENGNNNCAHHHTDFYLDGFAQETRL